VHVYQENDESRIKPCASAHRARGGGDEWGLMPLLSFRGRDATIGGVPIAGHLT
jgi:hypothetical protein